MLLQLVLASVGRVEQNLYLSINMFHFHSEAGVKAGEGHHPPPSRLPQSPAPLGQCRCQALCAAPLWLRWRRRPESLCNPPQDPAHSVSINVVWKPCYAVCPPHNRINMQPFTARSHAFVPTLNVENLWNGWGKKMLELIQNLNENKKQRAEFQSYLWILDQFVLSCYQFRCLADWFSREWRSGENTTCISSINGSQLVNLLWEGAIKPRP